MNTWEKSYCRSIDPTKRCGSSQHQCQRSSYAEAWQIVKAIRPCGAGFVGAIAWTSTRSMEVNYSTRGPKDGRRSRAKGSHRRDRRSRRFSNRCWKHFTRSSLSKNVLITQRKYACQIRDMSLGYRHNLFKGASYLDGATGSRA